MPTDNVRKASWDVLNRDCYPVFDNQQNILYAIHKTKGLLQYSFEKDTWDNLSQATDLPSHFFDTLTPPIAIDSEQTIYLGAQENSTTNSYNQNKCLVATLNINKDASKQKWHINDKYYDYRCQGTQAIVINDELHFIGGYENRQHLKYNTFTEEFDKLHDIQFSYPQLIKVEHKLLTFGGYSSYNNRDYLDEIHEYNLSDNEWIKCIQTLPKKMIIDGAALVLNKQYILLFGGVNGVTKYNDIWIYSVNDQVLKESKIKCPGMRGGKAFTIANTKEHELAVLGYVRSRCSDCSFPPKDVINIIWRYYSIEWIHLIDYYDGKHWKIDAFDVVNDT